MATDRERERKLRGERSRRQRVLPRIQRDTAGEVTRLLRRAERDIRATLAGTPSEFDAFALPRLQTSIRQALERMGAAAGAATAEAAARAWDAGIETVDAPLNAALQLDTPDFRIASMLPTVDTRQLTAMRAFVTHKMTGISTALADRINAEIGLVAVGTTSAGDAVGRIAGIMKTGGRSRALTVLRTELGRAYSVATQERQSQSAEVLPGLKKQWRRSGKRRSRLNHDAIDGQIREVDEPFQLGSVTLMFPRAAAGPASETINCGCQSLDWMESWEVEHPGRRPFTDEEIAIDPRRADLEGEPAALSARAAVRDNVATEAFRSFTAGQSGDRTERTVAMMDPERGAALGFTDRLRAVRLSAATVRTHPRFADFAADDWRRVQRIVDAGEWIESGSNHRLIWTEEDGKPWMAVVKRTADAEIYLQSYRRAQQYDVEKWREE